MKINGWNNNQTRELLRLTKLNYTIKEIAYYMNKPYYTIHRILKDRGFTYKNRTWIRNN